MARPKKAPADKRTERAETQLTVAEKIDLQQQAAAAGISEAEYVRRRILGHVVAPPPSTADAALITEINRIGVNVNQLARASHRGSDFVHYWHSIGKQVEAVLKQVVSPDGA